MTKQIYSCESLCRASHSITVISIIAFELRLFLSFFNVYSRIEVFLQRKKEKMLRYICKEHYLDHVLSAKFFLDWLHHYIVKVWVVIMMVRASLFFFHIQLSFSNFFSILSAFFETKEAFFVDKLNMWGCAQHVFVRTILRKGCKE